MALIFDPGTLRQLFGPQFNSISTLQVDVTLSEEHELPSIVTEKPVEDGSNINDNVILGNPILTISGILTDDRLGTSQAEKWRALQDIRRTREPFTVTTSLGAYENMIFTNIRATRDVSSVGAVFFTAGIKSVRIIASETAQVPLRAIREERKAKQAAKQDKGKQQVVQQTPEQAAETETRTRRSLAKQIFGASE
jgi:predicted GIY-YIG superfamily endonuclease